MSDTVPTGFPPVVYLPCAEHVAEPQLATIQMRQTKDGRVALLAYSALDRLHTCCGAGQPWLLTATTSLEGLHAQQPFDLLLLDMVVPEEHRGTW